MVMTESGIHSSNVVPSPSSGLLYNIRSGPQRNCASNNFFFFVDPSIHLHTCACDAMQPSRIPSIPLLDYGLLLSLSLALVLSHLILPASSSSLVSEPTCAIAA